jgi:MAF protein
VDIDENPLAGEAPDVYVRRLAEGKARAAARQAGQGEIILAADTTVADGDTILGKPADPDEARVMLNRLGDRAHMVYTAISVAEASTGRQISDLCATRVGMRAYTAGEIEEYIASGDPFDKAGGYAIQHQGFHPVAWIEGCYACVVGLPVCHVVRALGQFGLTPPNERVSQACPETLRMDTPCPDFEQNLQKNKPAAGTMDGSPEGNKK